MSSENKVEKTEFHQQIPAGPGRKSAILLAALMHVLLILFLWIGIHWQSETPVGVEAEIWDMNTRSAAPLPAVTHTPPPVEVKRKSPAPIVKEQEQKREQEQEQEQEQEREIVTERIRQKKLTEQKRFEEKEAKRKVEQQRIEQQKEEQQKQKEDLLKEEKKKQELAKIADQKKSEALLQQQRSDNLKRLTGQTGGTGDAVKSTGNNRVDPGYAGKIAAKIKSNMVYVGTDTGRDNPTADFVISLFPDGSLKGAPRKTTSSGVPAFDDAVERAITKSAPYPADKSGNVPSTIPLTYRLKD